eukprot:320447-Chlamydomonas_euryale.AAC.4
MQYRLVSHAMHPQHAHNCASSTPQFACIAAPPEPPPLRRNDTKLRQGGAYASRQRYLKRLCASRFHMPAWLAWDAHQLATAWCVGGFVGRAGSGLSLACIKHRRADCMRQSSQSQKPAPRHIAPRPALEALTWAPEVRRPGRARERGRGEK